MALLRNHQIFTPHWQAGLVPGQIAAMPAKVKVFTRTVAYVDNRPQTTETPVYEGIARIQGIRTPRRNPEIGTTRTDQTVRFQVKLNSSVLVSDKMFVRVTECVLNPALIDGNVYVLQEVLDGSNPIERTFEALADTNVQ